jgi:hypothetical protein
MELVQNIGESAASSSDLRALFHSSAPRSPLPTAGKGLRQERAQSTEQAKSSIVMAREL